MKKINKTHLGYFKEGLLNEIAEFSATKSINNKNLIEIEIKYKEKLKKAGEVPYIPTGLVFMCTKYSIENVIDSSLSNFNVRTDYYDTCYWIRAMQQKAIDCYGNDGETYFMPELLDYVGVSTFNILRVHPDQQEAFYEQLDLLVEKFAPSKE